MRSPIRTRHIPPRLMTGAFILDSGLQKRKALDDVQTAETYHGMAKAAYPFFERMPAQTFLKLLCGTELALGGALLLPLVPTGLAGAALTAFSGGLVGLYLRTPGTRREGGVAPSNDGVPLAKDSWLLGIGLGFLTDAAVSRCARGRAAHG